MHDLLGLNAWAPKFVKRYALLRDEAKTAFSRYVEEVAGGGFPPGNP